MRPHLRPRTPEGKELWAVLLLLLAAVLAPTAGVLWFMVEAMGNLEASVRDSLVKVYRGHLDEARVKVDEYWAGKLKALEEVKEGEGAAARFARLVEAGVCESAVIYDASGEIVYPVEAQEDAEALSGERWREAARLEFAEGDAARAGDIYASIAEEAEGAETKARALLGRARCLGKAGDEEGALGILANELLSAEYREAKDAQGRFIAPNSQLLALELMGGPEDARYGGMVKALAERLRDYGEPAMPSSQRVFLMARLRELRRERMVFPTLAAEELAAEFVAWRGARREGRRLAQTGLEEVWQLSPAGSSVAGLFKEEGIHRAMAGVVRSEVKVPDAQVEVLPAGKGEGEAFVSIAAGDWLPGWRLALHFVGKDPFAAAAKRQAAVYVWGGVLVIFVITVPAVLIARYVGRQIKLTGLRNNLIATVSHELKTPLASMRVLVETLLEGHYTDRAQAYEYLELIAKENVRLSRLIDNFLTFSRMERNRRAFRFEALSAKAVVKEAVDAVKERFESGGCRLEVEVNEDLPLVRGDRDALVTVLVNLLDNAYKYSDNEKRVTVRAYNVNVSVCLEVEDHGVGMTRRATKRIFDAFYQVDRRLSRRGGGTGLGLSIVKFIVTGHEGTIDVWSEPGRGSRFTVKLPAAQAGKLSEW